jgi:hypothetical protein
MWPLAPRRLLPQVWVLDGNLYETRCSEAGDESAAALDACALPANNAGQPLLQSTSTGGQSETNRVIVHLTVGAVPLNRKE